MDRLPEGLYKAVITNIKEASYRCRTRHTLLPGLFVSFTVSTPEGTERTYSEIVTMATHHKGTLSKLLGRLIESLGVSIQVFPVIADSLIGKPVQVAVKHSEYGEVFELVKLLDGVVIDGLVKKGEVA